MNVLKSKIGLYVEHMLNASTCLELTSACVCQATQEIRDKDVVELVSAFFKKLQYSILSWTGNFKFSLSST